MAVQSVQTIIDQAARREDNDLAALHQGEAQLLLATRIPGADEVGEPREYARHGGAQQEAQDNHLLRGADKAGAEREDAKGNRDSREPNARAEYAYGDG